MSEFELISTDDLLIMASNITSEYNKIRKQFCDKAKYYSRQALTNNYHKEEDMKALLDKCMELKERYKVVADILRSRNQRLPIDGWHDSNNLLFPNGVGILHVS